MLARALALAMLLGLASRVSRAAADFVPRRIPPRAPFKRALSNAPPDAFKSFRQRVLAAAKLTEVFEASSVSVEQRGAYTMARCPFHKDGNERTPSMRIDDEKGRYYCYSCQARGDAITYLQETEGLRYGEALGELASRFDVEGIDEFEGALSGMDDAPWQAPPVSVEQQSLIEANEAATRYFQAARKTMAAAECAALLKKRGVTNQMAERFALGFAADSWEALGPHLQTATNVSDAAIVSAGLCTISRDGGRVGGPGGRPRLNDRFRNRLIIPIHDAYGRVVGLGGRIIGDENKKEKANGVEDPKGFVEAKYLNSAESDIFKKSKLLYGMHLARGAIRKANKALIVEGYMDVIALHAAGIPYAVACLGTALNEQQIEMATAPLGFESDSGSGSNAVNNENLNIPGAPPLLKQVVLALDGDEAGLSATESLYESGAFARLAAKGIDVRVARLPPTCKDPDEYIMAVRTQRAAEPIFARGGPDATAAVLSAAGREFEQQVVDTALVMGRMDRPEGDPTLSQRKPRDGPPRRDGAEARQDLTTGPAAYCPVVSRAALCRVAKCGRSHAHGGAC